MSKGLEVNDERLFNCIQTSLHRDYMDFVLCGEVRGLQNRRNLMLLVGRVIMTEGLVLSKKNLLWGVSEAGQIQCSKFLERGEGASSKWKSDLE